MGAAVLLGERRLCPVRVDLPARRESELDRYADWCFLRLANAADELQVIGRHGCEVNDVTQLGQEVRRV